MVVTYADLKKAAELPRSTLSDLFVKGTTSEPTLDAFLKVCGVTGEERKQWKDAWLRSRGDFGSLRATCEPGTIEAAPTSATRWKPG